MKSLLSWEGFVKLNQALNKSLKIYRKRSGKSLKKAVL